MNLQFIADGLIMGALIGLGAVGVTLTYSILRFANFAHGEFLAWGTYFTLALASGFGAMFGGSGTIGALSFGWPVVLAGVLAALLTGLLALALDRVLFAKLRDRGNAIVMVMASFGASMALRSLLEFLFTSEPAYFSRDIQIATPIAFGIRLTPDQIFLLLLTLALVIVMERFMALSPTGRAMRAVSENPVLARVAGVDVDRVIRATWMIGGALACAAGVMLGITVQIRPFMGFDLLLPLFAAAILGGIGSVPGAVLGGLIVGLAEAAAVQVVGADYRAAIAFLILIAVLLVKPSGLFGGRA
ncbi:branched-chain amino acid ABC transporter permease [Nordella sp. HKS 07]|uniref:branched-chain amino acid ABC transporter permease n=1 Tax=Nordella sp. HKS 07 TaxID=2712222 RepID=UPI0013E1164C|nr:branched-chain amino acid ABC transporter permease [Nordella sp. HKS 07]QIG48496.1 branched-chain amino acid ABC transporter permease [Nordella sp. HKS 07]